MPSFSLRRWPDKYDEISFKRNRTSSAPVLQHLRNAWMSWCDFSAGCWYGFAMYVLGHPIETVKVQMHMFGNRGMLATARHVYDLQGLRGFYRGALLTSLHASIDNAVSISLYVGLHSLNKSYVKEDHGLLGCCEHDNTTPFLHCQLFAFGMASGLTKVAIGCPIELVKTRQQIFGINQNIPPLKTLEYVYNAQGRRSLRNFYMGVGPMYLREGPSFGCFVIVQEHLECLLRQSFEISCKTSNWVAFVSGGFAGVSYVFAGLPFDVIKTRMMTDRLDRPVYRGMLDCFRRTWNDHGIRIFFHGGLPAFLRAFLVNSIGLVVFENMRTNCLQNTTLY